MIERTTTLGNNMILYNQLTSNQNRYQKAQEQMLSGKKISKPSDDPFAATQLINLKKELQNIENYNNNMVSINGLIESTDNALSQVIERLQRVEDLAMQGSNETNSDTSYKAIKDELVQILETFIDLSNTKYNDQFIFSGTNIKTKTYFKDENGNIIYQGTAQNENWRREIEISKGTKVTVNQPGDKIFGTYNEKTGESSGIMGMMKELINAFEQDPIDTQTIQESIDKVTQSIENVSDARSYLGSVAKKIEDETTIKSINQISLKSQQSQLGEADLVETITNLISQQYALSASMQVSTQSLQYISLLNYM